MNLAVLHHRGGVKVCSHVKSMPNGASDQGSSGESNGLDRESGVESAFVSGLSCEMHLRS